MYYEESKILLLEGQKRCGNFSLNSSPESGSLYSKLRNKLSIEKKEDRRSFPGTVYSLLVQLKIAGAYEPIKKLLGGQISKL